MVGIRQAGRFACPGKLQRGLPEGSLAACIHSSLGCVSLMAVGFVHQVTALKDERQVGSFIHVSLVRPYRHDGQNLNPVSSLLLII